MPWVLFWIFPFSLTVLWLIERYDRRTYQARDDLAATALMRTFDAEVDALFADTEVAELEAIWDLPSPHGALPLRPFDPALHTYPRRPARHGSRNRLHRGF